MTQRLSEWSMTDTSQGLEHSADSFVAWIQVQIGISALQNMYSGLKHIFRIEVCGFCFPRNGDMPFPVLHAGLKALEHFLSCNSYF